MPRKFSLPMIGLRYILIAGLFLWLIAILASYAAEAVKALFTDSSSAPWLPLALETLAFVSNTLLVVLVLAGLWSLGVKLLAVLGPFMVGLFQTRKVEVNLAPPAPEAPEIKQSLLGLAQTMDDLERGGSKASLLLADVVQYTATLVQLITGITLKAEAMREEARGLQTALEAITSQDPLQIAKAAGLVKDAHIRDLLLCRCRRLTTGRVWPG